MIHSRIGRGVNDHAGSDRGDRFVEPVANLKIEFLTSEGDRRHTAERSELMKATAQLAISTNNQDRLFDHK